MPDIRESSKIVKACARIINNVGCSTIISNIITSTMCPCNVITSLCVKGAGICLGSALSDIANDYACNKIDEVATAYEEGHLISSLLGFDIQEEKEETTENVEIVSPENENK